MRVFSSVRRRTLPLIALVFIILVVVVVWSYKTVPLANMNGDHFDAILVLGCPATLEGEPSSEQQYRVDEGVREYQRGRASHLILSGGAAGNHFVEAQVMARSAEQLGVPASAIVPEGLSLSTYQNIHNSQQIMDAQGWHTVEVVSSSEHAHRAAVLMQATHLQWETHAAPTPGRKFIHDARVTVEEAVAITLLRFFGDKIRPVIHLFGLTQERIRYTIRWARYNVRDILAGRHPSMPYRPYYR